MSWIKENKSAAITVGVGGVLTAALVAYGFTKSSETTEAKQAYSQTLSQVKDLESRSTTPELPKVQELKGLVEGFSDDTVKLQQKLVSFGQAEIAQIEPNAFQEKLNAAVNAFKEKASSRPGAKVILPEGFFMGFEEYKSVLPKREAAGTLAYELAATEWLLNEAVDDGLKRVISVVRQEISQEESAPQPVTRRNPLSGRGPAKGAELEVLQRMPLELVIEIRKDGWAKLLSTLASSEAEHFFALRGLRIVNQRTTGPTKSDVRFESDEAEGGEDNPFGAGSFDFVVPDEPEEAEEEAAEEAFDFPGAATGAQIVKPVLGTESIYVALQLELIHFKPDVQVPLQKAELKTAN